MAYEFHYTPTGTGVISGKEVLEQTEDAINDLSGQISGDVQIAIDTANNALNTANSASADAQNAINTANTAYTAATNAQNTANAAQNTASNALTAAQNAQNDVNALGNRVTTAENNITQNTTDISGLTTRMGTAEGNITTLQNDVVTAQATANSAQQTATTARQQSYVLRYSSSSVTDNSTIAYSTLDNTDNIKASDKIIDSDGKIFSIVSVDNTNQTVTVGTALIDLALDANVMHLSGNETVAGIKNFTDYTYIRALNFTNEVASPSSSNSAVMPIVITVTYTDSSPSQSARLNFRITADGTKSLYPHENNQYALGLQSRKWSEVRAVQYYYGSSDVEFSNKFVTTDTVQAIDSKKTFNNIVPINGAYIGNEPSTSFRTVLLLRSRYDTDGKSGWLVSKFRSNSAQGQLSGSDTVVLNFDVLENEVRTNGILRFALSSWSENTPTRFSLIPNPAIESGLGNAGNKWNTINGINPGSLSMPDLNNGIDISGYITNLSKGVNTYTPPSNGWLSIRVKKTSLVHTSLMMYQPGGLLSSCETDEYSISGTNLPVIANQNVEIYVYADVLVEAKFYPCHGNV